MNASLFVIAAQNKYRFPSTRGQLTVEDLFDLPLRKTNGALDLDSVARSVNRELKQQAEESFVETSSNPAKAVLENKLEIIKAVIEIKKAEADLIAKASERNERRAKILRQIEAAEDREMSVKTKEELLAELAAL